MSKKLRLQLGAFVILSALVYVALQGAHNFSTYFVTVKQYRTEMARLSHQTVRVQGTLLDKSVRYDAAQATLFFTITSAGSKLPVVYRGAMPNERFSNASAIVKGRMDSRGVFRAQKLEVQCPNHYAPATAGGGPKG